MKYIFVFFSIIFFLSSCVDRAYYEKNLSIPNRSWEYSNIPKFPVHIEDKNAKYDIVFCLRHGANYNFSNLFVLFHQKGAGLKDTVVRKEINLAQLDGRWLGKSAGTLYDIQSVAYEDFVFPDTGVYTFAIEQNMRQNPLIDISDVGIKLLKK